MITHGPSHIKTLYDPSTDVGRMRNEILTEKIANLMPRLKDGCCALLLERISEHGFFLFFLTEKEEHPTMCQRWIETSPGEWFVIAAIVWGAKNKNTA